MLPPFSGDTPLPSSLAPSLRLFMHMASRAHGKKIHEVSSMCESDSELQEGLQLPHVCGYVSAVCHKRVCAPCSAPAAT